jgi:glucosylceramidase
MDGTKQHATPGLQKNSSTEENQAIETAKHADPAQTTRRDFLGISALGIAAAASLDSKAKRDPSSDFNYSGFVSTNPEPRAGTEISVWVTAGDERFAPGPGVKWAAAAGQAGGEQVKLDPSKQFQEILGFGGAFTDATCYTLNGLAPDAREKLLHEMFHPSEMGMSVCRTCIGSSDYSVKAYSFDDGDADLGLARFSIEHDREYILPVLREARKQNPDLFLFSSPWSPPGWMKFNGSMLGGTMRNSYLGVYAQYFLKFLHGYAAEGVPIQAVTPQNEVDTDQDGHMPACSWPQEYEMAFVGRALGPLLEKSGMQTKIWILDHNYNLWGRVVDELEDPAVRKYAGGVAWHGYVGKPEMMSTVQETYPDVPMYWTEGGPDYTDPAYLTDWCSWSATFSDVLRNWCRSITAWNLALDERGRPNIGPFSCGGTVTVNSQTKEITYSGQYWAFAHYARAMRRGARRFESQSSAADLKHLAAQNADGHQVLVLTNAGPARSIEVRMGGMAANVELKAGSVTTLAWRG